MCLEMPPSKLRWPLHRCHNVKATLAEFALAGMKQQRRDDLCGGRGWYERVGNTPSLHKSMHAGRRQPLIVLVAIKLPRLSWTLFRKVLTKEHHFLKRVGKEARYSNTPNYLHSVVETKRIK